MDLVRMGKTDFLQSLPHLGPSTQSILMLSLVRLTLTAAIRHRFLHQHTTSRGLLAGSCKPVCDLGVTTLGERFIRSDEFVFRRMTRVISPDSILNKAQVLCYFSLLCTSKYLSLTELPYKLAYRTVSRTHIRVCFNYNALHARA